MPEQKTITAIEVQKKNQDRVSIFLDGEFAFGIDQDVLVRFGLARGDVLAEEMITEILHADQEKLAKNKAFRLLAVRARSRSELAARLHQSGYAPVVIEAVLADLERVQLINDREFALSFARSQIATRPCGEFLLRRELKQKGIADELVEAGIAEAYGEQSQQVLAQRLAQKKKRQSKSLPEEKAKKRVCDLLGRRGFGWELISEIMEGWEQL